MLNTPSLQGCEAKFGRAKAHAEELRSEVTTVLRDDTYTLRAERDDDASQYILYVKELPVAREDWGLVFGDALHNFRASLDHLIVQLSILGQNRALTEEELRQAEFPVLDDPKKWQNVSGPRGVQLMRAGERERVRELQPFNASDQSIWGRAALVGGGARVPRLIEALHHADIADKHRFVHPSWCAVRAIDMPPLPGIKTASAGGQPLKHDSEVGRWGFVGPLPELAADLDLESYFPLGVMFPYANQGYGVTDFLDELEALIGAVIELFRPALVSGDPTPPVTTLLAAV